MFFRKNKTLANECTKLQLEKNDLIRTIVELRGVIKQLDEERLKLVECSVRENSGCDLGPWCEDCVHSGSSGIRPVSNRVALELNGEVPSTKVYCKKTVHEKCSGWEPKKTKGD